MAYIGNQPGSALRVLNTVITPPTYNVTAALSGYQLLADANSGPITINLPPISGVDDGFSIFVKKIDSTGNIVTIDGDSSDPINGSLTIVISSQWDGIGIAKDNDTGEWYSFASSGSDAGSGSGSGLTSAGGSDSMPFGQYDIGVNNSASLLLNSTSLINSYQYNGTGSAIVYGVTAANINGTSEVEVSMAVNNFSDGTDYYTARNIPVPANTSLELIKRPQILKNQDRLKFQSNSSNNAQIFIRYTEFDNNVDLYNVFYSAGTAALSVFDTMYTESNTNGSVVESIVLANTNATSMVQATIKVTDGVADPLIVSTMNVPAKASIELCENPMVLQNGHTLDVKVSNADILHVTLGGRAI